MHVDILSIHYRIIDYLNVITENDQKVLTQLDDFQLLQELKQQHENSTEGAVTDTIRQQLQAQIQILETNLSFKDTDHHR
jgi:hypothetical protein